MKSFDMAYLSEALNLQEQLYLTRANGERAYDILRKCLEELPNDEALLLVFPDGQLIDASFADETSYNAALIQACKDQEETISFITGNSI